MIETRAFDEAGREVPSPFGPQPMGIAIFDAERGMAMGCDSRSTLPPEAKRAFVAYCGRYTFDGTKLVTHADGGISFGIVGRSGPTHPLRRFAANHSRCVLPSFWSERRCRTCLGTDRLRASDPALVVDRPVMQKS